MDSDPNARPAYVARVPMMASAMSFAAGIVVARYIFHPVWLWLAAALLLGAAALYLRTRLSYIAYAAALVSISFVGGFVAEAYHSPARSATSVVDYANGDGVALVGTVLHDGVLRNRGGGPPDESLDLEVESVEVGDTSYPASGGIRLSVYLPSRKPVDESSETADLETTTLPIYQYGQRLRFTAKLHQPLNYRNPGAFDYAGYLNGLGIEAVGSAKAETVAVIGEGGSRVQRWRWSARRRVLAQIHRIWPDEQAGLFDAMVIGERAFLSRETQMEFQRSGTYHILVVSGMNVAIFAVGIYWLLRRIRAGIEIASLLTILMSVAYALLTDLGAPILRSIAMLAVYQVTKLLYRDRAALNAVGSAALAILVWDPREIFDPSFQLTFLSVAVIAGICVPLFQRTIEPPRSALRLLSIKGYDQALAPKLVQWRLDLRMIEERLQRFTGKRIARWLVTGIPGVFLASIELVIVSAMVQVALALPMAWYFHRLPFRGLLANLAVVPLTGVLMPACVSAVALSFLSAPFATLPAAIASWSLTGITGAVHSLGSTGAHDIRIAKPEFVVALLCALAVAMALLAARRSRWIVAASGVALLGMVAWLALPRPIEARERVLEITAIDVGQGEALLIVTPEGKRLLLDAGGPLGFSRSEFDVGEEVTSSYLWNRGIDRLDAVAISHAHSDHIAGMKAIVANFRPKELWIGAEPDNVLSHLLEKTCEEYGTNVVHHKLGDTWNYGGSKIEVFSALSPTMVNKREFDDSSMVLRIGFGNTSMLLPGDAHKDLEKRLATAAIQSDILKVAHHGSATSTCPEFLAAVRPRYALISAGRGNPFGHPRADVLKRLAEAHVKTYRTDLFGPVTFYLDGEKVTPSVPR